MRSSWILVPLLLASVAGAEPQLVAIAGETSLNGVFDPSLEYAPGDATGWLAYSAVYGPSVPWGPHVETRLARTQDRGASFSFHSVVNPSLPGTLVYPDGTTDSGVWNYEVSSLVHDADDPDPARVWKLFAHKIFRLDTSPFTGELTQPAYSWIVLRTAPHPTGPWSPEVALLSSGPLPPAPYDAVLHAINDMDESLMGMAVYSEPGAFAKGGVLYLSLTALTDSPQSIIVLASFDHGSSWDLAGTALTRAHAAALGYVSFDGSAIAEDAGAVYLLVTPESPGGPLHDGTLAFRFVDLAQGALEEESGVPVVQRSFPAIPGLPAERRGGQADYHQAATASGVLQPAIQMESFPLLFRVYATGERLGASPVPALGDVGRGVLTLGLLVPLCFAARRARCGHRQVRAATAGFRPRSPASSSRASCGRASSRRRA